LRIRGSAIPAHAQISGMTKTPNHEAKRLRALWRYRILDTPPETALDDLTTLAAHICGTPIALISLVDSDRIWFKSKVGWNGTQTTRKGGFSSYAIQFPQEILVVPDASEDERFITNELVVSDPYIRFYAGTPLITLDGYAIGTLCTVDRIARTITEGQIEALLVLGRQVIMQLELRANVYRLERTVTRQKRVEKALHLSHQKVRHTLEELQATQTQLIQTEKMSSLGQMVAGVAHEINNPVSFVYGNITYVNQYIQDLLGLLQLYQYHYPEPAPEIQERTEAIDLAFLSEDLPKVLASMKVGADRIRQIILSLRNFSRLDEAEKKPVDIHQGIDSTLLILQHRLRATTDHPGIEVIKQYGPIPPVECYAGQLNQVFMNILSNAIDALEQATADHAAGQQAGADRADDQPLKMAWAGDRTNRAEALPSEIPSHQFQHRITIRTEMVEQRNHNGFYSSALICIADNGPGIAAEIRERIFDPFFTTKPVGKGTGLGLSISYQIVVERHGGALRCLSEPGKGTEFWIEIPLQSLCDLSPFESPAEIDGLSTLHSSPAIATSSPSIGCVQ